MKKIKKCLVLLMVILFLNMFTTNTYAAMNTKNLSLHQMTKIYSKVYSTDYYSGCEENSNYKNQMPEITVLTHGLGSKGSYWSNDVNIRDDNGNFPLSYNESSLISKINNNLHGNLNVYHIVCGENFSFKITKYDGELENSKEVTRIDDVSKHIVLIYESAIPYSSNEDVYDEFENVLDSISLQYKSMTGYLPKFNLVGHSRGGITNIMYATEHPYNVASLISLGTPYNGSVLGNVDFILDALNFKDINSTNDDYYDGVLCLLDYDEAVRIRNAWNSILNDDVNINAIAYGSITSVSFLDDFIEDATNTSQYANLSSYVDLAKFIVSIIEKCPDATNNLLNFIDGMAEFTESAHYFYESIHNTLYDLGLEGEYQEHQNMYDVILSKINEDYAGSITTEEGSKILNLYTIINDEPVILDDLFIDLASQLGTGFNDGINFENFKRYTKIFEASDITMNRSIPNQPAVVHNLETMNDSYTSRIANILSYGTLSSNVEKILDDSSVSYNYVGEKTFLIENGFSANRTIKVSTGKLSIYKISNDNVTVVCENVNEYEAKFDGTYSYYVVVTNNSLSNTITLNISLNDNLVDGKTITLNGNEKLLVKYAANDTGYKLFSLGNRYVSASRCSHLGIGASINSSSNYYYFYENGIVYMFLKNSSSLTQRITPSFVEPSMINLADEEIQLQSNNKVMMFENPFSYSVTYQLKVSVDSGVSFYDLNNKIISSTHSNNTYTITLQANAKIYVIFGNTSSKFDMVINPTQMLIYINGVEKNSGVELTRGRSYSVNLCIIDSNGNLHSGYKDFVSITSNYYKLNDGILNIYSNAIVGNDIAIVPKIAPELTFGVKIGYNNKFNMTISNDDDILLNFINNDNDSITKINFTIKKNGIETAYNIFPTSNSIVKNLTNIIGNNTGTSSIRLNYIQLYRTSDGPIVYNGTSGLSISTMTVNNLFYGGIGTAYSPYIITCYRHLKNIKLLKNSYYKLGKSIDLLGKEAWEPFDFKGNLNGNGYKISNMKLNIIDDSNYGFISSNEGTIYNLSFYDITITKDKKFNVSELLIGVIVGLNNGNINYCKVYNTTADIELASSCLGVLVGKNASKGVIENSTSNCSRIIGSGSVGGLVGYNEGEIKSSSVYDCHITYIYNEKNGEIGLACGYNEGNVECDRVGGMLYWTCTDNDSSIYPAIGRIIGHNTKSGTYSVSTTNIGWDMSWKSSQILWWTAFDQGGRVFKFDDRNVGWQE